MIGRLRVQLVWNIFLRGRIRIAIWNSQREASATRMIFGGRGVSAPVPSQVILLEACVRTLQLVCGLQAGLLQIQIGRAAFLASPRLCYLYELQAGVGVMAAQLQGTAYVTTY